MDSSTQQDNTCIAVLGLGYVGCVTAACFANLGYRVIGIDKDAHKVDAIGKSEAPFYEPVLDQIIRETTAAGRLSASLSLADGLRDADVALICVGTPSERNGNLGLGQLRSICGEIAGQVRDRAKPLIVAIRSTVFPGTCEETAAASFAGMNHITVVSNPEFLREGSAVKDFMEPSLVVVGAVNSGAAERVAELYAPLGVKPCIVSLRTAEMIKYACNSFHAVKIAFANEIGTLASHLGVSAGEVMETLCQDTRLNISPAYLKPGFAFGGSCLPKDLRALTYRASRLDLALPLLESVLPSNDSHLDRAMEAVMDLPSERLGIFGLAFKENTDDLRESPVVTLIERLLGKGKNIRIFDPHIQLDQIYGSNKNFILTSVPHIGKLLEPRLENVLAWADHLVVTQKPSAGFSKLLGNARIPVMNLTVIEAPSTRSVAV
ncbi:MAG: nucleotide sugar dehydrogenase [Bryobacteraceae bacterium]